MKYIKDKQSFILEQEEMSVGEELDFQLREFQSKKGNLENLIETNIDTDKDITKQYEDIINENPFLRKYGQIMKLEGSVKKAENRIKSLNDDINILNDDIKLLQKVSDTNDIESQKERLEERIEKKNENIKELEEKIKELESDISESENELDDFIKNKEKEINELK